MPFEDNSASVRGYWQARIARPQFYGRHMRLGRRLAAPIRLSGGEISKLINGIVRALEASEFEERLARLEEKANEAD
jgi:hypothetical protein